MSEADPDTDRRCRGCNVPHADHPDANQSGGMGRLLPWRGGRCPACLDRRAEYRKWAAQHIVAARLDPTDDYLESARDAAQTTLEEVLAR